MPHNPSSSFPLSDELHRLARVPIHITDSIDTRLGTHWVHTPHLKYWYGTALINDAVLDAMQSWVDRRGIIPTFETLFGENTLNPTENRGASHIVMRSQTDRPLWLNSITEYIESIHRDAQFDTVIQVGIGGSELGPRAAYHALKRWALASHTHLLRAKFITNLDSDDGRYILSRVNLKRTLIIVASKSGSTLETHANMALLDEVAAEQGLDPSAFHRQWVVVTTPGSALDRSGNFGHYVYMDPSIGGRFSVTSPVGVMLLGLCFGMNAVTQLLEAAADMDSHSRTPTIHYNLPLLSALIGVWDRTYRGCGSRAVIPYAEGLRFLPAHLQQLECESCGKGVSSTGDPIHYATSPVVFGHTGTQAQHSFFQNFHQGTDSIPVEFVGVLHSQLTPNTTQPQVLASLVSQISALAYGRHHSDPRKHCPGNRPSTLVMMDSLTPATLGALIAYYENRTVFQGLMWNINPFDQEGVELGKLICQQVVSGEHGFPADLYHRIARHPISQASDTLGDSYGDNK